MSNCNYCKCVSGKTYTVVDLGPTYCMKCGFSFDLPGRSFVGIYKGKFNDQHWFILKSKYVTKCPSCGDIIEEVWFACGGSLYFILSEVKHEHPLEMMWRTTL